MKPRFAAELSYAGQEIARIQRDINHADVAILSASLVDRERSAAIRANVYIWLAALLEHIVRNAIIDSLRELSALGIPCNSIRPSLFSLLCDAEISSISSRNRQTGWPIRASIFGRLLKNTPAIFSEDVVPLDGKTIKGEHFDNIWIVFGLPGSSLPGPQHRIALKDLAEGRNDVAHGQIEPVLFGKSKATSDLLNLTIRIDEIILHFLVALEDYIINSNYAR